MEVGRRRIRGRIRELEKKIAQLSRQRDLRRQRRRKSRIPVLSIIGYTNVGKTSLLNALTKSAVQSADQLFVTLDPTSRRLRFPRQGQVIITDSVGFIRPARFSRSLLCRAPFTSLKLDARRVGRVVSPVVPSDTMNPHASGEPPSGRFLLRISPQLHALLRRAAQDAGTSLNDYCARKLAAPAGCLTAVEPAAEAVLRATALLGDSLIGVAAFGSWARRDLADGSDIDLLIVVDERVDLTRRLYREWDQSPPSWNGRRVEPHFVHLPPAGARVAGIWAEVAVDGIVLLERGLALSTRLAGLRRDIAAGRIVRRMAHGHPYWKLETRVAKQEAEGSAKEVA